MLLYDFQLETLITRKVPKYGVFSGLHFPAFELNTEIYGVSLRIQSECGKMLTRITQNTDTFYAVLDQ